MHPKLLYFRHKLFRYRHVEQRVADNATRLLDIGCGDGENMLRYKQPHLQKTGLEVSFPRLQTARSHQLRVTQSSGTDLPHPAHCFDIVYIAHVLHHVENYEKVLSEIKRVLTENGRVFIVETVTDHPILRLARAVHPFWQGDEVENNWTHADLTHILENASFTVEETGRYNLVFWLWEILPLAFWPFEIFSPIFVYLDLLLARFFGRYSVHCYFVLTKSNLQL